MLINSAKKKAKELIDQTMIVRSFTSANLMDVLTNFIARMDFISTNKVATAIGETIWLISTLAFRETCT